MKIDIFGSGIDNVNMDEAVKKIENFIEEVGSHHVITANAEIIYRASIDEKLQKIINAAHLVTPDGIGVIWAAKKRGQPLKERVTGIDLLEKLAETAARKGWRIFLYGAAPGVADEAAANLKKRYSKLIIAGTSHGYHKENETNDLIAEIKTSKPDILFVALGAPGQEYWISKHMQEIQVPVSIGVGGSFDVISGRTKRAPLLVQKLKIEWAYRIIKDPKRYKRAFALPKFVFKVLSDKKRD
jgi:N-acetylglucosaminyldiphosphoundecaprenol N-acetyl-beta-D-mannosaminyltransferase